MRAASLRWSVGALCALAGVLALLVPHHFRQPAFALIHPCLPLAGGAFLLVGGGLTWTAARANHRAFDRLAHLATAALLGGLTVAFARAGDPLSVANFGLLAAGVAIAACLPRTPIGRQTPELLLL